MANDATEIPTPPVDSVAPGQSRRLWWLPALLSCVAMIKLFPLNLATFGRAVLATAVCSDQHPCGNVAGAGIAIALETYAVLLTAAQWLIAYWLPYMTQRLILGLLPPALTLIGYVLVS